MAGYQLTMRSGPTPGKVFPLEKGEIILGRDLSCDIVVGDAEISRRHTRLYAQGGGYIIEDLGSTNGTTVNGQRLMGPYMLRPGEQVTLGEHVVLVYEAPQANMNATMASAGPMSPSGRPQDMEGTLIDGGMGMPQSPYQPQQQAYPPPPPAYQQPPMYQPQQAYPPPPAYPPQAVPPPVYSPSEVPPPPQQQYYGSQPLYGQPQQQYGEPPMAAAPPPAKKGLPIWLIIIIVLVVVCCLCGGVLAIIDSQNMWCSIPGLSSMLSCP